MLNNPSSVQIFPSDEVYSFVIRLNVKLKEEVTFSDLRYAVDTAIKRYPYLAQRMEYAEDMSNLIFAPNDNQIKIFHGIEERTLASEETNYHIQCISYSGKTICFDMCHGFADGDTMTEWVKTVLYYYLTKKHKASFDTTCIKTVDEKAADGEEFDPLKPYVDAALREPEKMQVASAPTIETASIDDFYRVTSGNRLITFCVNATDFISFCRQNEASPSSLATALIVKLLHEKNSTVPLPIACGLLQSIKGVLCDSWNYHNLVNHIIVTYPQKVCGRSIEVLSAIARDEVSLANEEETLKKAILAKAAGTAEILRLKSIKEKNILSKAIVESVKKICTFGVSYTGRREFGGIERYIESVYPNVSADPADLMIEIYSVGDKIYISFIQGFNEDELARDFAEYLEKNGVKVMDFTSKKLTYPRVKITID